jgi:hypothetical protein
MVLEGSSTLAQRERESEPLFWLCIFALVLCIVEGSREPAPSVCTQMSRSIRVLILVPFESLASSTLLLHLLPALCFLGHPHPFSVRGFVGFFGIADPPQFGCIFLAPKDKSVVPGCLGLDKLASCSTLVLWGLDQKLLVST